MSPDPLPIPVEVSRITCMVHQKLASKVSECLLSLGAHTILVENGRSVRHAVHPRPGFLPGNRIHLANAPLEMFRTTVPRDDAETVLRTLTDTLDLKTPGRGSLYAQDILEYSRLDPPTIQPQPKTSEGLLRDLTLLTGILSEAGSGATLATSALKLGVCVPSITRGTGTGIRDRLGLLRITIPPEKEIVHLMVPAQDAPGILRLLIEDAHLDRPGGGFLYQTTLRAGVSDTLMRIGRQDHAASIEQLIAAMDDLKNGTSWRKRFSSVEEQHQKRDHPFRRNHREVTFISSEGKTDFFVRIAMQAGAEGATTSRVRCLNASDLEGGVGARERGILCVPASMAESVTHAILQAASESGEDLFRVQTLDAPLVFSHQKTK